MRLRAEIKEQAKKNFTAQYWLCVGAFVLYMLIVGAASDLFLGVVFLAPPMMVGYYSFSLKVYRGQQADIGQMFVDGFSSYWRNVGGVLWMQLWIFIWSLLFIIPGIIKAFAYFMAPYILADSKNVSATQALKLSMKMTKGYKGKIFVMMLSFIGWGILTVLTFGILSIFWTGPYVQTSFAGMYDELKKNALQNGVITEQELA